MSEIKIKWRNSNVEVLTDSPEFVREQYDLYRRTHKDAGFAQFVRTLQKAFKIQIKIMAMTATEV